MRLFGLMFVFVFLLDDFSLVLVAGKPVNGEDPPPESRVQSQIDPSKWKRYV